MSRVRAELGLSRSALVALALLLGCDYCPGGVPGVGGQSALSIRVNRPALGGTVPISTAKSRRPALLTPCPAFIDHPVLGGTSRFQV